MRVARFGGGEVAGQFGDVLGQDLAIAAALGVIAALFGIGIMRSVALCEKWLAKPWGS